VEKCITNTESFAQCLDVLLQKLSDMPLEMLEAVLMRAFIMLCESGRSSSSERRAFILLSSVCCDWHQTLTGWPQSPTPHWVRHQLKKLIEREYRIHLY